MRLSIQSGTPAQVMAVTAEGNFYQYSIDMEQGGECVLSKQYNLLDNSGTSTEQAQ